jgi:hypothetical protein
MLLHAAIVAVQQQRLVGYTKDSGVSLPLSTQSL